METWNARVFVGCIRPPLSVSIRARSASIRVHPCLVEKIFRRSQKFTTNTFYQAARGVARPGRLRESPSDSEALPLRKRVGGIDLPNILHYKNTQLACRVGLLFEPVFLFSLALNTVEQSH